MPRQDRFIASCKSWNDFWESTKKLPSDAEKGAVFERLTQLYLQTAPEYQTELKHVWRLPDVPPAVRQRLNLPSLDEGIDLIACTRRGEYWAIQSKFRSDRDKALSRRELGTFTSLAFNTCSNIALAVVAHTSSKPLSKRHLMRNATEVGLDRWQSLDNEAWGMIVGKLSGRSEVAKARPPKPHQIKAVAAAREHFVQKGAARGRLIMPCGTGKSLTAFWIAEALKAKLIVVAVPSLALVRQGLTDWTREFLAHGVKPDWLCVCSDDSVGDLESDTFVGEVYDLGVPAHTDAQEIATFLRMPSNGPKVVFTTYQSSECLAEASRKANIVFDLAVLDEAHKTVGRHSKTFATLLNEKAISIRHRLFMTATERVARSNNEDVLSMESETDYGERFFQLSFKKAIKEGLITDYKILTVTVSDRRITELIDENRILHLNSGGLQETEAQSLASGMALRRVYEKQGIKHAISFHRSIRTASRFTEQQDALNGSNPRIKNFHISSKKTAGQRSRLLSEFVAAKRALMTNARCLTEGVDVPAIDCVMFADPKQSRIDIVQAAGRALRKHRGKEYGYILIPLIVPEDIDFDSFAATTAFRQVAFTITALSLHDERIAEEFRAIEHGHISSGKIVEIDGDVPVGMQMKVAEFAEAVSVRLWDNIGRRSLRPFDEARAFVHKLGLTTSIQWNAYAKSDERPPDIPIVPASAYASKGWKGWRDWLGGGRTPPIATVRRFSDAKAFAQTLGLNSRDEWKSFAKSPRRPTDIPTQPWKRYAENGWIGIDDWLGVPGTRRVRNKLPFLEARTFARSLKLQTLKEWNAFVASGNLPSNIPADPAHVYANQGWVNVADWLGFEKKQLRSYEEARAFVRNLKLSSAAQWRTWSSSGKRPDNIPSAPYRAYEKNGWTNWADWLGIEKHKRPFADARIFARSLGLKSINEWKRYAASSKLPPDIPARPQDAFAYAREGWAGWEDWLGNVRKNRPFSDARTFVHGLNLATVSEWRKFTSSKNFPADIPKSPDRGYAGAGWTDWGDWLGTGRTRPWRAKKRPFTQARAFVRSLNLTNWRKYARSSKRPDDIPQSPEIAYANEGWSGIEDWLGTNKLRHLPFEKARKFARGLKLTTQKSWFDYWRSKPLPPGIPRDPRTAYAKTGWAGFPDWLGYER